MAPLVHTTCIVLAAICYFHEAQVVAKNSSIQLRCLLGDIVPFYLDFTVYTTLYLAHDTRVGVKYNWSSTQILQVLVIKYKNKYKYFAFSPIKYSSTSSTDTPSTSTSVNIGWLIYGKYQGGNSLEIPPCQMITPVQVGNTRKYWEIQKCMYTCEY